MYKLGSQLCNTAFVAELRKVTYALFPNILL